MKASGEESKYSIYGKMAAVFLVAALLAGLLFLSDNQQSVWNGGAGISSIQRNPPGGGKKKEELEVTIGNVKDNITVEVAEEEYTQEELDQVFAKAKIQLDELILGENKSLLEVRNDLNLVTRLPENKIRVDWQLDHYQVMDLQGKVQKEKVPIEGQLVRLDAILSYGKEKVQYTFYAHVFPPLLSEEEQQKKNLEKVIKDQDEKTKTEEKLLLPKTVDGQPIKWKPMTNYRFLAVLFLGGAMALLIFHSEKEKKKEQSQWRKKQLELDYSQIISCFTLYLGAGMTMRMAWFKLAKDYEHREIKTQIRPAYEEMVYTMYEILSGASEQEAYERFGERCGLAIYRKFGLLLSQNLKKGTKGLIDLLKQESITAFEERKALAKMQGEEVGTKMLFPMFLMFGVVLMMIVIPAFLSIRI